MALTKHCNECNVELTAENKQPQRRYCRDCYKVINRALVAASERQEKVATLLDNHGFDRCLEIYNSRIAAAESDIKMLVALFNRDQD